MINLKQSQTFHWWSDYSESNYSKRKHYHSSPSVAISHFVFVKLATIEGLLVFFKPVHGITYKLAQLSLPLDQTGIPNIVLEIFLCDLSLPIVFDRFGDVDLLDWLGLIEPLYLFYNCPIFIFLLHQLVLDGLHLFLFELPLNERLIFDVPFLLFFS